VLILLWIVLFRRFAVSADVIAALVSAGVVVVFAFLLNFFWGPNSRR
jgi:hypothetical protein